MEPLSETAQITSDCVQHGAVGGEMARERESQHRLSLGSEVIWATQNEGILHLLHGLSAPNHLRGLAELVVSPDQPYPGGVHQLERKEHRHDLDLMATPNKFCSVAPPLPL